MALTTGINVAPPPVLASVVAPVTATHNIFPCPSVIETSDGPPMHPDIKFSNILTDLERRIGHYLNRIE